MDSNNFNKKMRSIYCIWLQKNLDLYEYVSPQAKELKNKFSKAKVETDQDIEMIKSFYLQFYDMFLNQPLLVLNGIDKKEERQIITHNPELFFVDNDYGVPVPVKFLKEQGIPISNHIAEYKENAMVVLDELKNTTQATISMIVNTNQYISKRKGRPRITKAVFVLVLIAVCISCTAILSKYYTPILPVNMNNGIIAVVIILMFIILICYFLKAISEIGNSLKTNKAGYYHKYLQQAIEDITNIQNEIEPQCEMLVRILSMKDGREMEASFHERYLRMTHTQEIMQTIRMRKNICSVKNPLKKFSIFMMVIITAALISLTFPENRLKLQEFNKSVLGLFEKKAEEAYSGNIGGLFRVIERMVYVKLEPKDTMEANIVAQVEYGSSFPLLNEVYDDKGILWGEYQIKDDLTGWIDQRSMKYIDQKEITIKYIEASSEYTNDDGDVMGVYYLFDDSCKTTWMGSASEDAEPWVQVDFDESYVSKIVITNGYAKSDADYRESNRINTAKVTFSSGEETIFYFVDVYNPYGTEFIMDSPILTSSVKISIVEVYEGEVFNNNCISEIAVFK